jgi:osmotically-inducible protein OsmY
MHLTETPLERRVGIAIERSPYLAGRNLRVETAAGLVILKGIVGSYYQKQMAQEAARRIDGVQSIENRLEVLYP